MLGPTNPMSIDPLKDVETSEGEEFKPLEQPKSNKDFKKLVKDDKEDKQSSSQEKSKEAEKKEASSKPTLASNKTTEKISPYDPSFQAKTEKEVPQKAVVNPSSDLVKESAPKEKSPKSKEKSKIAAKKEDKGLHLEKGHEVNPGLHLGKEEGTTPSQPIAHPAFSTEAVAQKPQEIAPTSRQEEIIAQIKELAHLISDRVSTVESKGQTDTSFNLTHPPIFANARITVSAFDTAKGEFNLAFENLSQQAKDLIDLPLNQEQLHRALDEKGFKVHIIYATSEWEKPGVEGSASDQATRFAFREGEPGQEGEREETEEEENA